MSFSGLKLFLSFHGVELTQLGTNVTSAMELQERLHKYTVNLESGSFKSPSFPGSNLATLSIKISLGYGNVTTFHCGGERNRWEFFLTGPPLLQVTLAEHQANPGDVILSNEAWKMVMSNCDGKVLSSGDVKLISIAHPIAVQQAPPIKLNPLIEPALTAVSSF